MIVISGQLSNFLEIIAGSHLAIEAAKQAKSFIATPHLFWVNFGQ